MPKHLQISNPKTSLSTFRQGLASGSAYTNLQFFCVAKFRYAKRAGEKKEQGELAPDAREGFFSAAMQTHPPAAAPAAPSPPDAKCPASCTPASVAHGRCLPGGPSSRNYVMLPYLDTLRGRKGEEKEQRELVPDTREGFFSAAIQTHPPAAAPAAPSPPDAKCPASCTPALSAHGRCLPGVTSPWRCHARSCLRTT